jgi:hypothetical protein
MIPAPILQYLWLLLAVGMLLNVALAHLRAGALVRAGQVSDAERWSFSRGAAAYLVGFCLILQLIVWVTGEARLECLAAFPPTTPASVSGSVLTVATWGGLLWWVWRGNGADRLGRFGPMLMRLGRSTEPYSPAGVRRAVTILALVSVGAGIVGSLVVPPPPDCRGVPSSSSPASR